MGYVDKLLATGERLALREHQHWFVVRRGAPAMRSSRSSSARSSCVHPRPARARARARSATSWAGSSLGPDPRRPAVLGWQICADLNEDYVVTNRRVLKVEGVLKKRSPTARSRRSTTPSSSQSLFGRMLRLRRSRHPHRERGRDRALPDAPQARRFKRTMLEAKHELELEHGAPGRCPGAGHSGPARAAADSRDGARSRPRAPAPAAPAAPRAEPRIEPRRDHPDARRAWPTCAIAARSAPRNTRRRRPTCSAACSIRTQRPRPGYHTPDRPSEDPLCLSQQPVPIDHRHRVLAARRLPGPRVRPRARGVPARRRDREVVRPADPRPARPLRPVRRALLAVSILVSRLRLRLGQADAVQPDEPRGRRWGEAIVAAAGPISNLILRHRRDPAAVHHRDRRSIGARARWTCARHFIVRSTSS